MSDQPEPSFEEALAELQSIVAELESGGLTLAESLSKWERGEQLTGIAQRWLDGARARIASAQPES